MYQKMRNKVEEVVLPYFSPLFFFLFFLLRKGGKKKFLSLLSFFPRVFFTRIHRWRLLPYPFLPFLRPFFFFSAVAGRILGRVALFFFFFFKCFFPPSEAKTKSLFFFSFSTPSFTLIKYLEIEKPPHPPPPPPPPQLPLY